MTETLVPLEGSVPMNVHHRLGAADPKERIDVTIVLRRKSEDGLPTLAEFVAGQRAKGVTRHTLAERYGASSEDAERVQAWAKSQGLTVTAVELGLRQVSISGCIDAMEHAFGITLSLYRHTRTDTQFRCPQSDIHVPQSLSQVIVGVFGLNDMPVVVRQGVTARSTAASGDPKQDFPGAFYPHEVAALYNFPPTQGDGQRVAILEFGGGFDKSVLANYFTHNIGLSTPPTVNAILVSGAKMDIDDGATGEVYLDIEVVGAMAPKAVIDVFFAPWTGLGYFNAIQQAVKNAAYASVSISYGLDEDMQGSTANPGWPMLNTQVDESFRDATAIGLPVFVSSGDQGSGSLRGQLGNGEEITLRSPTAHVGYPASSPYATAVGGSMLYAEGGVITHEVVWNELGDLQEDNYYFGGATGGGVSDRYPQVPSYQTKAGITLKSVNDPPAAGRCVPDVAGNSGATTGYLVSQPPGGADSIAPVGGTSAAAPMWAALLACVQSSLSTMMAGKPPTFFLNDFLYEKGGTAAFRDIVEGRQITYDANGNPTVGDIIPIGDNRSTVVDGYSARQGYDLCTGWGSPNGVELLNELVAWLRQPAPADPPQP